MQNMWAVSLYQGQKSIVLCTFTISGRWVAFLATIQGVALGYAVLGFQPVVPFFCFYLATSQIVRHVLVVCKINVFSKAHKAFVAFLNRSAAFSRQTERKHRFFKAN